MSKQPIYENPNDSTSPIIGYGAFIPEPAGSIYEGSYVDFPYSDEQKEAIAAGKGTHFFDPAIIPTVQYQVYGLDNVWFWDNEGQNYTFSGQASTIEIQVVTGTTKTYYKVGTLSWGDETTGAETKPADGIKVTSYPELTNTKVGQTYYIETTEDESTTYSYKSVTASLTPTAVASEISNDKGIITSTSAAPAGSVAGEVYHTEADILSPIEDSPYEFNKYGKEPNGKEILVTIDPNDTLVNKYPGAIVTINGQEHDLSYLAPITSNTVGEGAEAVTTYTAGTPTPIRLYMDKDYRISINWVWGSIVETFRIICNR